jgi:cell division protein FtsB
MSKRRHVRRPAPKRPPASAARSVRFRVALGVVATAGLLFAFVFPTSSWWDQRRELHETERRVELLRFEADQLERERDRLRSDEEVERVARERFNLVKPGETAWAIVPGPDPTPTPVHPGAESDTEIDR